MCARQSHHSGGTGIAVRGRCVANPVFTAVFHQVTLPSWMQTHLFDDGYWIGNGKMAIGAKGRFAVGVVATVIPLGKESPDPGKTQAT